MSKILIQSVSDDHSTDEVVFWLRHLDKSIAIDTIFNQTDIQNIDIEMSNKGKTKYYFNNIEVDDNVKSWYRRGFFFSSNKFNENYIDIHHAVKKETFQPLIDFLNEGFDDKQINKFNDNNVGKLNVLRLALQVKLNIPDVLITGNYSKLKYFVAKSGKVITKPIRNPIENLHLEGFDVMLRSQSKLITIEDLSTDEFKFMPSYFQKYIEKKYEIRSFYLKGEFKSMAIFSQQNEKTKTDFRNYDLVKPNRCVPYQLPKKIEKKLHKLMLKLGMNCGSFDIIVTPENKYFFLEVNPVGQFQWLSYNCNYYIERFIAKKIIENE